MLPNTYQEIYDTQTCLNFSKTCQNVCLYFLDILKFKSWCNFISLLAKYVHENKVGWGSIFQNSGSQGPGQFEGSALEPFFHVFLRLNQALIV